MPEDVTLDEMFERVQKQRDNAARTAARCRQQTPRGTRTS